MRMVDIDFNPVYSLKELHSLMESDGDGVPDPTHIFVSDRGVVKGACSLAYAPCLFFWMHTKRSGQIESYRAFGKAMAALSDLGHDKPILLIEPKSPFYPYLQRLGYSAVGKGEVFLKD